MPEFEKGLTAYAYERAPALCQVIDSGAKLNQEQIDQLHGVVREFKKTF